MEETTDECKRRPHGHCNAGIRLERAARLLPSPTLRHLLSIHTVSYHSSLQAGNKHSAVGWAVGACACDSGSGALQGRCKEGALGLTWPPR